MYPISNKQWRGISYLVHGATENWITTVNGLLDKRLLDIIDHQEHTIRLVVDEQTDPSTL